MLRAQGIATVQIFGLPDADLLASLRGRYQAAVLSLKSRSIPAADAVRLSLAAANALSALDPAQWAFKYCSTFDSTPAGNIGPVTNALLAQLNTPFTVAVPALPVNGRTQYLGHLFVQGVPLHESPMKDHPLNPMTDANLVRWLQRQTQRQIGLIPLPAAQAGRIEPTGEIALVDAVTDADLQAIAKAVVDFPLITGGSGLGAPLAQLWLASGRAVPVAASAVAMAQGPTLILSGSCSAMTLRQLAQLDAAGLCETLHLQPGGTHAVIDQATTLLRQNRRVVIRSSAAPGERFDEAGAAQQLEQNFGQIAQALTTHTARLIVAGGETSGAVVEALALPGAEVEAILAPGVPALRSLGERPLRLALKSGNFGGEDFFLTAIRYLES